MTNDHFVDLGEAAMKQTLAALLLIALPGIAYAEDPASATRSFREDCERLGKALWGRSLCAPIVLADPGQPEPIWTSTAPPLALPPVRANTAIEWDGRTWLMLLAPLPAQEADRRALMFHEAFHVHQRELGLPPNSDVAGHLDSAAARESIRLEWNALANALQSRGKKRRTHMQQALAFRAARLASNPAFAVAERQQMLHEGLAAYTGVALSGDPGRLALAALRDGAAQRGYSRNFAYASGPAWGLLLDRQRPGWRKGLDTTTDLPELMGLAPAATPTPDAYDGAAIHAQESAAAAQRQAHLERLLAATDPARSLRLPLARMGMDFDPDRVTPAPDGSNIYEKMTLRDAWGSVHVDGQALRITADFTAAFVQWPLPAAAALQLAPGWTVTVDDHGTPTLHAPDK